MQMSENPESNTLNKPEGGRVRHKSSSVCASTSCFLSPPSHRDAHLSRSKLGHDWHYHHHHHMLSIKTTKLRSIKIKNDTNFFVALDGDGDGGAQMN
jgi:hypothetical protein